MELLNQSEIACIAEQCGYFKVLNWNFEEFENKVVGNLGDHLNLIIEVESDSVKSKLNLFVKCMPRSNAWKAKYIRESLFFKKEYVMLSQLFNEFKNSQDSQKWRPKLVFSKEDVLVFENVSLQGYRMSHHQETMTFEELKAACATLARFHAQSYIFEERKSKELGRPYRIWEDYSEYLQEPSRTRKWRDTGVKAVIEYLKVFSKHKSVPNFSQKLQSLVPGLFDRAIELTKPSTEHRNVVTHRDLWTNNIFLKKDVNSEYHALFIDFQTVLYCSPMLDLSSLIYFNTSRSDRTIWKDKLINFYYTELSREARSGGVYIDDIIDKGSLMEAYEQSIVFGITQASLITPIVAMSNDKREEIFFNPESSQRANFVSRSDEFIDIAKGDDRYQIRITELFDEMVERFVLTEHDE